MHMYIHIYYNIIYIYIYIHIYACMYIYLCMYTCVNTHSHTHTPTHPPTHRTVDAGAHAGAELGHDQTCLLRRYARRQRAHDRLACVYRYIGFRFQGLGFRVSVAQVRFKIACASSPCLCVYRIQGVYCVGFRVQGLVWVEVQRTASGCLCVTVWGLSS